MKVLLFGSLLFLAAALTADEPLVVHEWGTFTSLQDETGQAIGGINTDDEPVPRFVHDATASLLIPPSEMPVVLNKGLPRCYQDVTMRLETPVLYFHLPVSTAKPIAVDVNVEFRGGWLTQFYPSGDAVIPARLANDTIGTLSWPSLKIGSDQAGPVTSAHVWTSPRAVSAASVTTTNGESEKFLFYRGVGHLDAPLHVVRDHNPSELLLYDNLAPMNLDKPPMVDWLWLADIRKNGTVAFRQLPPVMLTGDHGKILATTPAAFRSDDYSTDNMGRFRQQMHDALVQSGLFSDEADALLNTWEVSYFKSAGLRLFYIVPRVWTDHFLPLHLSAPAQVTRVMVGRIELVTPEQRQLLRKIAHGPTSDMESFMQRLRNSDIPANQEAWSQICKGQAPLTLTGVPVPAAYQAYLELGRFRSALVLDAASRGAFRDLSEFIRLTGLEVSKLPPT